MDNIPKGNNNQKVFQPDDLSSAKPEDAVKTDLGTAQSLKQQEQKDNFYEKPLQDNTLNKEETSTSFEPSQQMQNQPIPNQNITDQPPAGAADSVPSEAVIATQSSSKGGGFKVFVIIGLFIVLGVWGGVGYLYFQNRSIKSDSQKESAIEDTPEVSPTPEFTPDQIKIKGGNIVNEKPNGEEVILVNKDNYESTGITGFLKVIVSPDMEKLCFESWPPAPKPAVYISNVDGNNVLEVSVNKKNCIWSDDSINIYYVNIASDNSSSNIYGFNLANSTEKDMTSEYVPAGKIRQYEIVGLSADGTRIICEYKDIGSTATDNSTQCEIDLETGKVSDL